MVSNRKGPSFQANGRLTQRRTVPMQSNLPVLHMPPVSMPLNHPNGKVAQVLRNAGVNINPNSKMAHAMYAAGVINDMLPPNIKINKPNLMRAAGKVKETIGTPVFKSIKGQPSATVMNSSYGLSKAPNPKAVRLNSGIMPNTYANDYMFTQLNLCAPMHIAGCSLQIPTATTSALNNYFINNIAFDIQTRAQANVGFSLDIANTLSSANLLTAFNTTIQALHIYFYYTSILSYESDPRNKNEGMINLRQGISPQLLSDLAQLGRRLEDTPVPPRIVQWIKYMNGNYLSGNSQGAPIIKLCFDPTVTYTFTAVTPVQTALTNLVSPTNNAVFGLIRRAIPHWKIGVLTDVPTLPSYDQNFKTVFANLPSAQVVGSAYQPAKQVANNTTSVSYNSYNNILDGVAYACSSVYNLASGAYEPGLVSPTITSTSAVTADSRLSWYTNGTTKAWTPVSGSTFLTASRAESSQYYTTGTETTAHLSGAEKCQLVNSQSLTQTAQNTLDFLFELDSIPVNGKLSNFNNQGSPGRI